MTAAGKAESAERQDEVPKTVQKIHWEPADWTRITEIAGKLSAETHLDVNPTDAVRAGVRRLHEALFPDAAA